MKFFCILVLLVGGGFRLMAQTNELTATNQTQQTQIYSDSGDFDSINNRVTYRDHVLVLGDKFNLTSVLLVAHFTNGVIDHIVATTNVVIHISDPKQGTNLITADQADYIDVGTDGVTNKTITLTGNPKITGAKGVQEADKMIWDCITGDFKFFGGHGTFNHSLEINPLGGPTNSPSAAAIGTNLPPTTLIHTNQ